MRNQEKVEKIREFLSKLQKNIENRKQEIEKKQEKESSSTMIPFYDLFYEQIKQLIKEEKKTEENESISAMLNSTTGPMLSNG